MHESVLLIEVFRFRFYVYYMLPRSSFSPKLKFTAGHSVAKVNFSNGLSKIQLINQEILAKSISLSHPFSLNFIPKVSIHIFGI